MTRINEEPQMGFEEEVLYNPDLLEAIEDFVQTREAAKRNRKAKKQIKKHMPQEEGRYRCGPYLLVLSPLEGGGITIEPWSVLKGTVSRVE